MEIQNMGSDTFYERQDEPTKSCLLAMRSIIMNFNDNFIEAIKYGSPCFLFKGKICCYLWIDKKTKNPYFLFVDGKYLSHPVLESGDRKRMKVLNVNPNTDLPLTIIEDILREAISLHGG